MKTKGLAVIIVSTVLALALGVFFGVRLFNKYKR